MKPLLTMGGQLLEPHKHGPQGVDCGYQILIEPVHIRRSSDDVIRQCISPRRRTGVCPMPPFQALRNEAGTVGSDPCRCVIFVDAAVVEQQA
jgi:hypothetical protein